MNEERSFYHKVVLIVMGVITFIGIVTAAFSTTNLLVLGNPKIIESIIIAVSILVILIIISYISMFFEQIKQKNIKSNQHYTEEVK